MSTKVIAKCHRNMPLFVLPISNSLKIGYMFHCKNYQKKEPGKTLKKDHRKYERSRILFLKGEHLFLTFTLHKLLLIAVLWHRSGIDYFHKPFCSKLVVIFFCPHLSSLTEIYLKCQSNIRLEIQLHRIFFIQNHHATGFQQKPSKTPRTLRTKIRKSQGAPRQWERTYLASLRI